MQKQSVKTFIAAIFVIFFSFTALVHAAVRQQLKCYIVPKEYRLYPIGRMAPDTVLHLAISMPIRHHAELDQLTQGISDPRSPEYRHFLTPQEFTRRFAPAQADYDAVIAFFKHKGFTVTSYPNRILLDVDGTVRMVEAVFHTAIWLYKHPTESRDFYAADEDPSVDLGIPLSNISGLDNFMQFHPLISKVRV